MTERSLGEAIAAQIRKHRLRKGWSVRRLAEECERLGMPTLTEASLGNIERGQREDAKRTQRRVLVEELAVLAAALDVPPILLTVPLGGEPAVQVLPDRTMSTWEAMKWWTGEAPTGPARPGEGGFPHVRSVDSTIEFYREHDQCIHSVQSWPVRSETSVKRLLDLRTHMRRAGILPPELPSDLVDLEEGAADG